MYLNFPGTTEQAFLFYRQVFQTEFLTDFQRFRSIPPVPDQPPMPEAIKDLILHVSLPIMDGFILMGTDVTEELGMRVEPGNHMHLNLYTESREEATRLFAALSAGGTVTTPMQDMFWGAYYGSCIDKFGINWMVSHQNVITY